MRELQQGTSFIPSTLEGSGPSQSCNIVQPKPSGQTKCRMLSAKAHTYSHSYSHPQAGQTAARHSAPADSPGAGADAAWAADRQASVGTAGLVGSVLHDCQAAGVLGGGVAPIGPPVGGASAGDAACMCGMRARAAWCVREAVQGQGPTSEALQLGSATAAHAHALLLH